MPFGARTVCFLVCALISDPHVTHYVDPTVLGPNTATVATAAVPELRAPRS